MKNKTQTLKMAMNADESFIPAVLGGFEKFVEIAGLPRDLNNKIQFGIEDLLSELMQIQDDTKGDFIFEIIIISDSLQLQIIIKDRGVPYEFSQIDVFSPENIQIKDDIKGIGIYSLKNIMDSVTFHNLGKEGREIILCKYLDNKHIKDSAEDSEQPEAKPEESKKEALEYYIRAIKDNEAIEISRCAYFSYGYSYIYDDIYYPQRVLELNKSGKMLSKVAVLKSSEKIIGHTALSLGAFFNVPEMGVAFVDPRYRGMKCLEVMTESLLEDAKNLGFEGVFVQAVCSHIYSQKACHRFGFRDTAVLLLRISEMSFKSITEKTEQRESLIISYFQLRERSKKSRYVPDTYKDIIREIYESLSFDFEFCMPPAEIALKEKSSFSIAIDKYNTATIIVKEYGRDFSHSLRKESKRLCLSRIDCIYAYLCMSDPYTFYAVDELKKADYIFSGIMPSDKGGDFLVMQYLNNCAADYNKILVESDIAKKILKIIKSEDRTREVLYE